MSALAIGMDNLKRLTAQQWVLCASGSVMVAGVMLSHDNKLGLVMLALAAACGIGAFLKSKNR